VGIFAGLAALAATAALAADTPTKTPAQIKADIASVLPGAKPEDVHPSAHRGAV